MKRFAIILALFVAGCAAVSAEQHFAAVGSGLAAAKAGIVDAQGGIAASLPHADAIGQGILGGSTRALTASIGNIDQATAAEIAAAKDFAAVKADRDRIANSIGWRVECFLVNLGWILLAIGIVIVVVVPILWAVFGADLTTFGTILRTLHAALPVQNLGQIVKSLIPAKSASPAVKPITVGKPAPTSTSLFLSSPAEAGTISGA